MGTELRSNKLNPPTASSFRKYPHLYNFCHLIINLTIFTIEQLSNKVMDDKE